MINISNIFSNTEEKLEGTNIESKSINPSPSLNQGKKFKKYQNKIEYILEKNAEMVSEKEGFTNQNIPSLTMQTKNIIDNNDYSKKQPIIDNLRNEYEKTLNEYQALVKKISGDTAGYLSRVNPNNPYLNKTIKFSTGHVCYVTSQGVVKYISTPEILNSLNIPKNYIDLNIPWKNNYSTPGIQIPTNPPLITGTFMKLGQSVGSEGSNVFVNEFLPQNTEPTYMGCYAANNSNNNMTFIGGSPPPLVDISIQNGSFSQPVIANNTFRYISGNSVPNWYFTSGAALLNNSTAWAYPIPYPNGNQCVTLQNTGSISQIVSLIASVTYTLTFNSAGRNCCTGSTSANPINIQLYTTNDAFISTINTYTPPINVWQKYTITFTVPTTQSYKLTFSGTNTQGDKSSGIQNISLSGSSLSGQGSYTYSQCKQAAINNGYQYFALQNTNPNTSTGYCGVSNSQPAVTQFGESRIPTKFVVTWQSNTSGNPGNSAILTNTGMLSVVNSSGEAIFSSDRMSGDVNTPSNYLGCYGDGPNRAMSLYNNGSQQYNLQQCLQIAQQQGAKYFGLQNSTSGKTAQCGLSNDMTQALKYGRATNCTRLSDGSSSGGGWSNAVYNAVNPQSNYVLIVNDFNILIQRGRNPTDNQGLVWAVNFTRSQDQKNSNYEAVKGKYGKNWISSGDTLAAGDWIGSPNGYAALIMRADGNLVLNTFQMESNCKKMNDNNMGGGIGANASYNIGKSAITKNMGSLGYIDEDSKLHAYPSSNQVYINDYKTINGVDTLGNDIPGAAFGNATVEACKRACDRNSKCGGFVTNSSGNICWPKTNSLYPFGGPSTPNPDRNIYIRNKVPSSPPIGVSKSTNNIDTVTYQNYVNGGAISNKYGLANANTVQKKQLEQLQSKLNLLSKKLKDMTNNFQIGTSMSENQSSKNVTGINNYLINLNNTNKQSLGVSNETSGNVTNILKDSDIVVLQKNYEYLVWSILAAGTVLVSMNVIKNQ